MTGYPPRVQRALDEVLRLVDDSADDVLYGVSRWANTDTPVHREVGLLAIATTKTNRDVQAALDGLYAAVVALGEQGRRVYSETVARFDVQPHPAPIVAVLDAVADLVDAVDRTISTE